MQQRSVADRELQDCLVGGQHLAVVLVDKNILDLGLPLWSDSHPPTLGSGYTGGQTCKYRTSAATSKWHGSSVGGGAARS